jgi:hypothetical protein
MKVNVYTKDDMVKSIELNLEIGEYFVIQKALCSLASDMESPMEDRIVAVMLTEDMNKKEQVELSNMN